jgi:hypothetical protein
MDINTNIPKIKLDDNITWKDYIKSNELDFWKMTIDACEKLGKNPDVSEITACILYNKESEKEIIVTLPEAEETLERALTKMEELEQYEECSRIVNIKEYLNF